MGCPKGAGLGAASVPKSQGQLCLHRHCSTEHRQLERNADFKHLLKKKRGRTHQGALWSAASSHLMASAGFHVADAVLQPPQSDVSLSPAPTPSHGAQPCSRCWLGTEQEGVSAILPLPSITWPAPAPATRLLLLLSEDFLTTRLFSLSLAPCLLFWCALIHRLPLFHKVHV